MYNCDDQSYLHTFLRSSNFDLSYIHLDTWLNKAELYRVQDKVYEPFTSDVNVD